MKLRNKKTGEIPEKIGMKKRIIELLPYIIHGAIAGFMMFEIIKHI